jgi:aquaporin Z
MAETHSTKTQHEQAVIRSEREFRDPRREWRRLLAEFIGTWLTTIVIVGAHAVGAGSGGEVTSAMAFTARGLMTMGAILFLGTISGAHLNPAVTFGFALRGNFPWQRVPGYLVAQFAGAVAAAALIAAIFGDLANAAATTPGKGISTWQAVAIEVILTAGLIHTILGTASNARNLGTNNALAVGAYVILAGFWAGPVSGASMNPFRSLAPDIMRWDFSTSWIYFAGPLTGVVFGVAFEWLLKGPPTVAGNLAAQGAEAEPE